MQPAAAPEYGGARATTAAAALRIFVVRHEKRPLTDPSFDVSLTDEGLTDAAQLLLPQLQQVGFTKVFASPFRRVLQTIQPYLSASGLRAHVDWALYEHPEPNNAGPSSIYSFFSFTCCNKPPVAACRRLSQFVAVVPEPTELHTS